MGLVFGGGRRGGYRLYTMRVSGWRSRQMGWKYACVARGWMACLCGSDDRVRCFQSGMARVYPKRHMGKHKRPDRYHSLYHIIKKSNSRLLKYLLVEFSFRITASPFCHFSFLADLFVPFNWTVIISPENLFNWIWSFKSMAFWLKLAINRLSFWPFQWKGNNESVLLLLNLVLRWMELICRRWWWFSALTVLEFT